MNADVPAIEVLFVDEVDPHVNLLGIKGMGEIGIVGAGAAIANAVYHATGNVFTNCQLHLTNCCSLDAQASIAF